MFWILAQCLTPLSLSDKTFQTNKVKLTVLNNQPRQTRVWRAEKVNKVWFLLVKRVSHKQNSLTTVKGNAVLWSSRTAPVQNLINSYNLVDINLNSWDKKELKWKSRSSTGAMKSRKHILFTFVMLSAQV